jgi:hypothetical protein
VPNRRTLLASLLGVASGSWLSLLSGCKPAEGQKMQEIKFDLGKDIEETAAVSGVPKFSARDLGGYITYSVNDIPKEIPAHFTRSGYEILWRPVFAFSMDTYANKYPNKKVMSASLQLNTFLETHEQAQAFFEQTFAQFQKGKWQRYFDDNKARINGRSSYLDEAGALDNGATGALDPYYKIPAADWKTLASNRMRYKWIGDGVLASLDLGYTDGNSLGLNYTADLGFELFDVYEKRIAERAAEDNKKGDAKGWNSTAKYEAGIKSLREKRKLLEAAALKRGDTLVPKP